MHRILYLIIILGSVFATDSVFAQKNDNNDRRKMLDEVRNFKHGFLVKELDLDKDQQEPFFTAYDEMENRIIELNNETKALEEQTLGNPDATDVEIDATARAIYQLKNDESKIELEYYDKFRNILKPRQLIRLKNAERKFTQQLMHHHRRLKKADLEHKK